MPKKNKNIFIFVACALVAGGISAWFYFLNYGTVIVSGNVSDYQIAVNGQMIDCKQNPCSAKLNTGVQTLQIQKTGYVPYQAATYIKRFGVSEIKFTLEKIPVLNPTDTMPEIIQKSSKPVPETIGRSEIIAPAWNADGTMLAYYDPGDGKLKVFGQTDTKIITSFRNLTKNFELSWSPDNNFLFGEEGDDIYFINIPKASRKKEALGFSPHNLTWLNNSSLLFDDDTGDVYLADMNKEEVDPFSVNFNLGNSVFDKTGVLISYNYDDQKKVLSVESLDAGSEIKQTMLTKNNFPVSKIYSDTDKNIFLYNSEEAKWYKLDY